MRLSPRATVSPRLIEAAEAEIRRNGLRVDQRRIKILSDGTLELDLTTPDHVLTRRGR